MYSGIATPEHPTTLRVLSMAGLNKAGEPESSELNIFHYRQSPRLRSQVSAEEKRVYVFWYRDSRAPNYLGES